MQEILDTIKQYLDQPIPIYFETNGWFIAGASVALLHVILFAFVFRQAYADAVKRGLTEDNCEAEGTLTAMLVTFLWPILLSTLALAFVLSRPCRWFKRLLLSGVKPAAPDEPSANRAKAD
jgi:hypothetical protein